MTTSCHNIRELLNAFADQELNAADSAEVARHIVTCGDCAHELNSIRILRSRTRVAVLNEPVPDDLRRRITASLEKNQPAPQRLVKVWAPLAVAAMLLVSFGVSWNVYQTWSLPRADRVVADAYVESLKGRLASVLRVAMTDHIHCAVFRKYTKNPPFRAQMASDLGPQFENLMPVVRAQVPEQYRLEQAHRCTSGKREYVHMIFRDRSSLISMIATIRRPGESLAEVPPATGKPFLRTASVDEYQIAAFDAGPFMAYIVSDIPQAENIAMASALVQPISAYLNGVNPVRVF